MTQNNRPKKRIKQEAKKVRLDLSIETLELMIKFCVSQNSLINFKKLRDMYKLFKMLDKDVYEDDRDIRVRIHVIDMILKCVVDFKITAANIILERMRDGRLGEEAADVFSTIYTGDCELSNNEVQFVEEFVSDRLKYSFVFIHQGAMEAMLFQLRTQEFESLGKFCREFKELIGIVYKDLSSITLMNDFAGLDFSTTAESLDGAFTTSITELGKDSNIIATGIQKLNDMLNGGFQAGRVYLVLGDTGGLIFSAHYKSF